jgi:hypothetical protein
LRLRLAARLILLDGTQTCVLTDLSAGGARIRPAGRLREGAAAVLLWGTRFEAFGQVVWLSPRHCGIAFDEPLSDVLLQATRALDAIERLPEDRDLVRRSASAFVRGTVKL